MRSVEWYRLGMEFLEESSSPAASFTDNESFVTSLRRGVLYRSRPSRFVKEIGWFKINTMLGGRSVGSIPTASREGYILQGTPPF